ncbi:DNA binding domain-containing protein, excisionase family [Chryseobacterium sp. RU37D]|uniref:helix-turn-helix domain-containing protein n=1 Tax=Chryseobacterium sp. RU37D TaxID=1907397 RepID=UPI0009553ADC|nr:helix-turn-helix domain-containing protein [Chryseobacterium sp. RU37D]SIQ65477.1 DNA binding domain-containing protein, excisionase family [Chryseobacterium sp. RU37D]
MANNITQVHNTTPEDFKNEILNGIQNLLSEFKKDFGVYDQNTYLTRNELAKMLKISLPTLRKNVERGLIPETPVAGRVLYNLAEVKEALKNPNWEN